MKDIAYRSMTQNQYKHCNKTQKAKEQGKMVNKFNKDCQRLAINTAFIKVQQNKK